MNSSAYTFSENAGEKRHVFFIMAAAMVVMLVFFVRGNVFGDFSFTLLLPPAVALTAALLTLYKFKVIKPSASLSLFFIFVFLNQAINLLVTSEYELIARFCLEMLLNFLCYYVIYALVAFRIIGIHGMLHTIQATSLVLVPPIIFLVANLDFVRRIGAKDVPMSIAVNHMGHAAAIASMISLYFASRAQKSRRPMWLFLHLLIGVVLAGVTFLSGSKAAVLPIVAYVALWLLFKFGYLLRHAHVAVIIAILAAGLTVFVFGSDKYEPLMNRFLYENIERGIQQRVETFANAWEARTDDMAIVLGESWRYEPINGDDPIPYPHNFFLAILLHTGLMPLVFFAYFILTRVASYARQLFHSEDRDLWVLFNGIVWGTLAYVLTSGQLTRVMTIFVVFAMIEGYVRDRALQTSEAYDDAMGSVADDAPTLFVKP